MSDLYQQTIIEAAQHPQNLGRLKISDKAAAVTNASCGDDVQIWLKFDDHKHISEVGWEGQGCIISQAAMSELSEFLKGKSALEVQQFSQTEMLNLLGLKEISAGRLKCLMLGLEAVKRALSQPDL